jgi:hypothetical protein
MAKIVYSSPREICHLWANQSQNKARTSKRTVSFFGNELYSYSTKIAELFPEHNFAMVTTRNYSITRAKHQRYLRNALPSHYRIIEVYDSFRPENIIDHFKANLETQIAKLKNARTPAKYLVEIEKQRRNAELYLQNFSEIYKGGFTRAGEERFYQQLTELIEAQSKFADTADSKALAKAYTQDKEAKEKEKREQIREEYNARVKAWKNHERDSEGKLITVPQSQIQIMCGETDFARLSKDGKEFESHRGARIPKNAGLALFRIITAFITEGKEVELPITIGSYTLNNIYAEGNCVIGCHRFSYEELKSVYETVADKQDNETLTIN